MLKSIKEANPQAPNTKYIGLDVESSFEKHWVEEKNLKYRVGDIRDEELFKTHNTFEKSVSRLHPT